MSGTSKRFVQMSLLFGAGVFTPVTEAAGDRTDTAALIFTPYAVPDGELPPNWRAAHDAAVAEEAPEAVADQEQLDAAVEALLELIRQEEERNGPNSRELIEYFRQLGRLNQDLDWHDRAILAFDRALQISRMHFGLYSLDYADTIERAIASWLILHEYGVVDRLDDELIELVQRSPNDARGVPILTRVADRRMDAAERFLAEDVSYLLVASSTPGTVVPSPRRLARRALRQARGFYNWALVIAVQHSEDTGELLGLQDKVISTYYFELENDGLRQSRAMWPPPELRGSGTHVLEVQLENSFNYPGTPVAIAEAMVELADWSLLFALHGAAIRKYEAVNDFLSTADVPEEEVARLLAPAVPVVLPAFGENIEVVDPAAGYLGYVDVAIETTRYGRAKNFEFLSRSPEADDDVLRMLKRIVAQSRFRPRFENGELIRNDYFALRYYFDY